MNNKWWAAWITHSGSGRPDRPVSGQGTPPWEDETRQFLLPWAMGHFYGESGFVSKADADAWLDNQVVTEDGWLYFR